MLKGKLLIALASAVLFLGACSNETTEPQQAPETSQEATTEGYTGEVKYETLYDPTGAKTDVVSITMNFESGKPTSVAIDVLMDGQSKKALAASGEYVMSQAEGALQWDAQIEAVETFLTENNFDTTKINITDEDGHTDTLTGVSMKVGTYVQLVQDLMDKVAAGETEFGFSGSKKVEFEGEKGTDVVEIVYNNGTPVNLNIDNIQADGSSKRAASEEGTYDMGGELKWHEQMDLLEDFIVANNFDTTKVNLTDEDGHTDAVTGVSIKVGSYLDLVTQALEQTK
ncbi:MAG: hypothetical protein IJ085_00610 [Turicibacter sp.]|nr:hypothetical protein [Turicibacter sp.]